MFEKILIPISSEFYSRNVLDRGVFLAKQFKSTVTIIYIIEEKTLDQTDKLTDTYLTPQELENTKKDIISKHKQTADNIVFDEAKFLFKNTNIEIKEKIIEGEFSEAIHNELIFNKYDLILMNFQKESLLNYRLLTDVNIPVWIESKNGNDVILAVCSNLAPNQKVPDVSMKLAKALNWKLHILYVVDTEDTVVVDENGRRSDKKPSRDLICTGQCFLYEIENKGIQTHLAQGSLEKETMRTADELNANLIIVGREQKKKGLFGFPVKNVKRKIAEKSHYSVLFLN